MDTQTDPLVLRQDKDGVATLTLNRADKRNALSIALFKALEAELDAISSSPDTIGVVVLHAAGAVFSAGADLNEKDRQPRRNYQASVIEKLARLPQPVIAAVQGICFTGALELVLACDIILARDDAVFADTHAKWSLTPGWGLSQRLPRRIGTYKAREMMFTGRQYDAPAALAMGLVNFCVAGDEFEGELQRLTCDIAGQSWFSHRGNKALLLATDGMELSSGLAHEIYYAPGRGADISQRLAKGGFGSGSGSSSGD